MRRVVLKYPLTGAEVNEIRTGPNPVVRMVDEQAGSVCVWLEVDQVSRDLSDPGFRAVTVGFVLAGTGWVDAVPESGTHVGSINTGQGLVWHVYGVDEKWLRVASLRRQHAAQRILIRTQFGAELRAQVRERDQSCCRFCGELVVSGVGLAATSPGRLVYDVLDLSAPLSIDNVVLACGRCASLKGSAPLHLSNLVLRPAPPAVAS